MTQFRLAAAGVAALIVLIASLAIYNGVVGHNNYQDWQIVQGIDGSINVQDASGYYYKGFATVYTYPRTLEAFYEVDHGTGDDKSIRVTFNDAGTANVGAYVRVALPTDTESRLRMHQDFAGNPENIKSAIRAHLVNCIKASGPIMSASENQASRKAEFNQIVEEQLAGGLYKMRRTEIELDDLTEIVDAGVDADGNKVTREKKAKVQATEIVLGDDGVPIIIQPSPLRHYGLSILQFSITETEYDQQTLTQFMAKKDSYLKAEQAKAQRQEEVQQRLMIQEKGLRQIAEIEAEENQKKERAIIQAEQAAAVAVIKKDEAVTAAQQRVEVAGQAKQEAETLKEIAQIEAETAELKKKATISAAEARQQELELGGGISEEKRVLAEIEAERDAKVAEALATVKVPGVMIIGGQEGSGGSLTENLINMALLKNNGLLKDVPVTVTK